MRIWRLWTDWQDKRRTREDDLGRELRAHLDLEAEERQAAGIPPEEARYAAQRAFGNVTQVKEEMRELWGWRWIEQVFEDARYAFRCLRKNPGFSAVAVLSLALGIGGNAAMFSIVNGVLLQPLPYPQPERLVRVTDYYPKGALIAMQQDSRTMDVAGASSSLEFNLTGRGEAARLIGSSVSANLFSLVGAAAEVGNTFVAGEDQPGRDQIVILSHALLKNRFGGDPRILGHSITLDGVNRQVVGVMPPDFSFPSPDVQLWIPLHLDPSDAEDYWGKGYMPLIARLRPGATLAQAQNELRTMIPHIITLFSFPMGRDWNSDAKVVSLQQDMVGDIRPKVLVLWFAVGIVLLVACANVANLLLSRATARSKEIGLRRALGAARGRLVRQFLTESVVLALAGGALGLALAFGALSVLKAAFPPDTPQLARAGMDWRVLTLMTMLAVLAGLVAGLAPALSASNLDLAGTIKSGGQRSAGVPGVRLRSSLIAAEVALAVILTIGAGLLIKSLWLMTQANPGFSSNQLLTVRVFPSQSLCANRAACVSLYNELLRRARGITGVAEVAATNAVPLSGETPAVPAEIEGHPLDPAAGVAPLLWAGAVTPDFFRIMRIPLLVGRAFSAADGEMSDQVIVVSAATARHYWPAENPLGKHIRVVWDKQWRTVVGVVGDVQQFSLGADTPDWMKGAVYMPYPQSVDLTERVPASMDLIVRTGADPAQVAGEIRSLVRDVNPNVPVSQVRTLREVVSGSTSKFRSMMWLFVSFAASALILAAVGTYGVVSYSISQRTYEMGVRVALGATKAGIFVLVLGQSLRLVLSGLAAGVAASLVLNRMLSRFLYGITPTDPLTFLAVGGLLVAMALLAGYFPARRAASIDPLMALRAD
jgi:putative ABC transport system permease protein